MRNFSRYVQTSSVVLAVYTSAHAVASIAVISLGVNSIALEAPSSTSSPSGSSVYMVKGVIGSVEYGFVKPASMLKRTWTGAAKASPKALSMRIIRVDSVQVTVSVFVRLIVANGVTVKAVESTSISDGTIILMSPDTNKSFFVSNENVKGTDALVL